MVKAHSLCIRRPLLRIDCILPGRIVDAPHFVDIAARRAVLGEVLVRVVPGHVGGAAEPDSILTIAMGVDVLGVTALQGLFAGPLPSPGSKGDAESAGVALGNPCPFRTVPDGIVQGGVRPGLTRAEWA